MHFKINIKNNQAVYHGLNSTPPAVVLSNTVPNHGRVPRPEIRPARGGA